MKKVRILLADDHVLFREGLRGILSSQPDMEVVGEANDGVEAVAMAHRLKPDVVLMDIGMAGGDGIEATRRLTQECPLVTTVMLTMHEDDEKLFQAIKYGAQGYLLKSMSGADIMDLIRAAVRREVAITPSMAIKILEEFRRLQRRAPPEADETAALLTFREREVLDLVAQGRADKQIADALSISLHTVKTHVRNILEKLQAANRREAAYKAKQKGLLSPGPAGR